MSKELGDIKNNHMRLHEMKNTLSVMKTSLNGVASKLNTLRVGGEVNWKIQKQKLFKMKYKDNKRRINEQNHTVPWDNIKHPNLCVIAISVGKKMQEEGYNKNICTFLRK